MAESQERPDVKGQMLPGIASICIFMVVLTIINVYESVTGAYGTGRAKYGALVLCTLLAIGIFGLMRLAKWGWAIVAAGCLLLASGYFFYFAHTHVPFFFVQALFFLLFFLYLVRPETRDRLR